MKKLLVAPMVLVVGLCFAGSASADWAQPFPGPLNTSGSSGTDAPAMATLGSRPYVAWSQREGSNYIIQVAKLSNTNWRLVGTLKRTGGTEKASYPSLAVINGSVYAAWEEYAKQKWHIYVSKYLGGTWQSIGGDLNTNPSVSASRPRITGVGGVPYVAWKSETSEIKQGFVSRFDGSNWQRLGGDVSTNPANNTNWITVTDVGGTPYTAWAEQTDPVSSRVFVARWDGTSWQIVGGPVISPIGVNSYQPRIVGLGNVPYVAWEECDSPKSTPDDENCATGLWHSWVARLEGANWQIVGNQLSNSVSGNNLGPALTTIGDKVYASWEQYGGSKWYIWVARLDTDVWTVLGSALNGIPANHAIRPNLVGVNGVPYAAWDQYSAAGALQITVSRLAPTYSHVTSTRKKRTVTFSATANTYGVDFPVGFLWGKKGVANKRTSRVVANGEAVVVTRRATILAGNKLVLQPYALPGAKPFALGPAKTVKVVRPKKKKKKHTKPGK